MDSSVNSELDPLDVVAEEFVERLRRHERPAVTEFVERFPQLAKRIRDLFPALVEMERAGTLGTTAAPFSGPPLMRLGEFRILREIGRGGMGVVYEAIQESLGRHVALKLLTPSAAQNPHYLERFRREAKAVAKLHHTNI